MLNRLIITLATLVCIHSFNSCNTQDKNESNSIKPSIVVVLCDMSKTVENQNEKLFSYIKRIPFCFNKNSKVYYLPINENSQQSPLNDGNPIILPLLTDADDNEGEKERVISEISMVINELKEYSKTNGNWTCILTSIENAYKILSQGFEKNMTNFNYQLIIFSDMKESCLSSPVTEIGEKIEMGRQISNLKINHSELDTAILRMKKYDANDINFDKSQIEVTIISTTSGQTSSVDKKISATWNDIFSKMKYRKKITISSQFPFTEIE